VLLGARESGVAVPGLQMVSRSTIGREQQWDEFGQLRVRVSMVAASLYRRHLALLC
jgi:hypothetical protein